MSLRITKDEEKRIREKYKLVGVHCVSCKRVIESELSKIPGIVKAEVDPNTGMLTIVFEEGADRKEIVVAVRRVGYDVVLEKLIFRVHGLKDGMGRGIEARLKKLPGVVDVRVFEANRLIRVEFDPLHIESEDIIRELERIGLRAELGGEVKGRDLGKLSLAIASVSAVLYFVGLLLYQPLTLAAGLLAFVVALYEFFIPAGKALLRGYLIMDTLLALGTGTALFVSIYGLLTGGAVYFEAIVFITLFVVAGRYVEKRLRERAEEILSESANILPKEARVERGGSLIAISVDEVAPGEIVVVRAGERIPVDGRVYLGEGEVDESPVTGESEPRHVQEGDLVLAGSTLVRGWLKITCLRTGKYRLVERALEAAREAGLYKPRLQELADRIVGVFVPVVLAIAAATVVGHVLVGSGLTAALIAAATVLVVACPCALGIAIPTAIAASVARAHRLGLILKRPDTLEPLSRVSIFAFDKTGTLTRGRPRVVDVKTLDGSVEEVLFLAASLESESTHPIAEAIVSYYKDNYGKGPAKPESLDEIPGRGLVGVVNGRNIAIGGHKLVEDFGLEIPKIDVEGLTRIYVIVDGKVAAVIGVEDEIRDDARETIEYLSRMGIKTYILSGDSPEAVRRVAAKLGIPEDNALGGLDPLEKAHMISRLKKEGRVAYVGDGVNDGPALAEADVGIAVNEALDVARQAGDIVLAKNDLRLIPALIKLAKKTARTTRFNLFWAFAYNAVLIPIAAGVLLPWGITIQPEMAALAMSLSSITVTSNSARILYWKP